MRIKIPWPRSWARGQRQFTSVIWTYSYTLLVPRYTIFSAPNSRWKIITTVKYVHKRHGSHYLVIPPLGNEIPCSGSLAIGWRTLPAKNQLSTYNYCRYHSVADWIVTGVFLEVSTVWQARICSWSKPMPINWANIASGRSDIVQRSSPSSHAPYA